MDPPALIDLEGPNRVSCYAVVCGSYQLHGEEGEKKGLHEDVGDGTGRSVNTPTRTGDYRVAISDPRVVGSYSARTTKQAGPTASKRGAKRAVDESDLSETTTSDPGAKADYGDDLLRYACQMDDLLDNSLRLNREMLETRSKGHAGGPTGQTKRYNAIKREWTDLKGSLAPELGRKICDGAGGSGN